MKEQEDIDHLFKSAFDDFAVAPPASVKESLDLAIAAKRKKKFVRWFFAGVIAFVILFVTAVSMLDNAQRNPQLAENTNHTATTTDHSIQQNNSGNSAPGNNATGNDKTPEVTENVTTPDESDAALKTIRNGEKASKSGKDKVSKTTSKKSAGGKNSGKKFSAKAPETAYFKPAAGKGKTSGKQTKTPKTSKGKTYSKGKAVPASNGEYHPLEAENKALAGNTVSSGENKSLNEHPSNENKTGNGSSKTQASKENKTQAQKEAPVAKVDSAQTADSTTAEEEPEKAELPKKQAHPLLFSLRGGTTFGFNQLKTQDTARTLTEKGAFFIHGEATYFLNPKMAITSGFNYEGRKENVSQDVTKLDSVVTGSHMEYIFDSVGIIDSFMVDDYGVQSVTSSQQNSYKLYAVSLPVLFSYSQPLTSKLSLDLSAGAILSLQGSKVISETYNQGMTIVNKFGVRACVRTQLRYQFSAWGVSLNTNFGYDLFPVNTWNGVTRTRTFLDLGIGVHYLIGK